MNLTIKVCIFVLIQSVITQGHPFTNPEGIEADNHARDNGTTITEITRKFDKEFCAQNPCVKKCCPVNTIIEGLDCIPAIPGTELWNVTSYQNQRGLLESDFTLVYGLPEKPTDANGEKCIVYNANETIIYSGGWIYVHPIGKYIYPYKYCLDDFAQGNATPTPKTVACYNEAAQRKFRKVARNIIIAFQVFSLACTLIIIFLHFPKARTRYTQDRSFFCLSISLMVGIICSLLIIIPQLSYKWNKHFCTFVGFASQYVYLTYNSWLTIRSYDIFRIIRGTTKAIPLQQMMRSSNRFLKYCLFSYGFPLLVSLFTIVMQFAVDPNSTNFATPQIGAKTCWLSSELSALLIYYFVYQFALHALSMIFILVSAYFLYKNESTFQCCKRKVDQHDEGPKLSKVHNKPNLEMFCEQFYIFTFTVTLMALDSISIVGVQNDMWRILDILNSLQGFYMLIIVLRSPPRRQIMIHSLKKLRQALRRLVPGRARQPPPEGESTRTSNFQTDSTGGTAQSSSSNLSSVETISDSV